MRTRYLGFVSPGNAETLVRSGGITDHHLLAYSFSNSSAKNYENRLMSVEVILCYISVFLRHGVHKDYHVFVTKTLR